MSARRRHSGSRNDTTGRALIAAAVLAGTALAIGTPPASAAPAQAGGPLRLELVDQALAFSAGDDLHLEYLVTGDLATAGVLLPPAALEEPVDGEPVEPEPVTPGIYIQVTNYPRLDSPAELDGLIGADVDRDAYGTAVDGVQITDGRALIDIDDGAGRLELRIPTDVGESEADKLLFNRPGIHPLRIEIVADVDGERTVLATAGTVVQRLPDAATTTPPLNLSLMAAVAEPGPEAGDEEVDAAAAGALRVIEFAGDVTSAVTAGLPPRLLTDLTSTESGRTSIATALTDDELTSLPAVPLDVSSAAAVDRVDAFARQLRAGEDLSTAAVPTTPTRRDVWIAQAPLSASGAQVLRDLGTRFIVMTPDLYLDTVAPTLPATDRFVEIELTDGGRIPLLVIDGLGEELADSTSITASPTEHAVQTLAALLLDPVSDDPTARRSRVVADHELGALDPSLVTELERLAESTPDIRFVIGSTLTGLTDTQRVDGEIVTIQLPTIAGPSLETRIRLLDDTSLALASAASMLDNDDPRLGEWTAELDAMVSTSYTDDDVNQRVDALLREATRLTTAVVPPEPFTFTLTGRSGEIELPFGNRLGEPVRVLIRLSSPKIVFPEGDIEVVLDPGVETRIVVPVESRANGTSAVEVEMFTPLGEPIGETVRLTSRVNALTGLGQVLTGGLVLVLLTWWFTHWRSRRRAAVVAGTERHPAGPGNIA